MKILNVVLILAFLSVYAVSPAYAQTGKTYTFIPLVTKADANVPLWVQAQQEYEKLLPTLMKAKKKGEILEWQPEFNAGILGIKYAANARRESFTNAQQIEDFHATLALVPQQEAKPNPEGGSGLSFELGLFSSCFYAYNVPANANVKGTLYDKTGKFLAGSFDQVKANTSYFFDCFEFGGFNAVTPGAKVSFQIYDATNTTLLGKFIAFAPTIEVTNFYQAQAMIAGKGPKNKAYFVDWYHVGLGGSKGQEIVKSSTISTQGDWNIDLSNKVAIRGGDYITVGVQQAPHFTFDRFTSAPSVNCALGENYCYGHAGSFQQITIMLVHAGLSYSVNYQTNQYGDFSADFYDTSYAPILLTRGDQVTVTGLPTFTLPNLTAKINFATNVISGAAPMNSPFALLLYLPQAKSEFSVKGKSATTQNYYAIDMTSLIDLKADQINLIYLYYTDPITGNKVSATAAFIP